jgi:hypothetical protein
MRITRVQPTLFSLLTILLTSTHPTTAKPYPRDGDPGDLASVALIKRCANPCGYYQQLCCGQGQACLTDSSNQPTCGGATAAGPVATTSYGQATAEATAQARTGGQWMYITTTITETDFLTEVSTSSTYVVGPTAQGAVPTTTYASAPAPTQGLSCDTSQGQTACGSICCAQGQFCAIANQCEIGGYASGGYNSGGYNSGGYSSASTFSAPLRPTSGSVGTGTTITGNPASTVPFQTPVGTAGGINYGATTTSNNGLSGGAIAGIVIGVIAGIILLILLCAACCFRAGFDGLRDLFGIGRKRRVRSETRIEERYSRHGSGGGRHGGWFGSRPTRVDQPPRKSSGLGGLGAVTAGLAGLAIALGLKRRRDRNEKSNSGSSYSHSDSYYDTSESESF